MIPGAGAELRFVDSLLDSGYRADQIEFAEKKDNISNSDKSTHYDIDVLLKVDGGPNYAYQVKRFEVEEREFNENTVRNNSQKSGIN